MSQHALCVIDTLQANPFQRAEFERRMAEMEWALVDSSANHSSLFYRLCYCEDDDTSLLREIEQSLNAAAEYAGIDAPEATVALA